MQYIHYKDLPPVNLARVGAIGKENQQLSRDVIIYAIGFFEFERKLGYWAFQSQEERDQVFDNIRSQFSQEVGVKNSELAFR